MFYLWTVVFFVYLSIVMGYVQVRPLETTYMKVVRKHLSVAPYVTLSVPSRVQCAALCERQEECQSFSVQTETPGSRTCLLYADRPDPYGALTTTSGGDIQYYHNVSLSDIYNIYYFHFFVILYQNVSLCFM